jgi:hypothetical protein
MTNAACPDKCWYDEKRCSQVQLCGTCDFLRLPYEKKAIEDRIKDEQDNLRKLLNERKHEKKGSKKYDEINMKMLDKVTGVLIMQDALVHDFGMGFRYALERIALKKLLRNKK